MQEEETGKARGDVVADAGVLGGDAVLFVAVVTSSSGFQDLHSGAATCEVVDQASLAVVPVSQ